MIPGHGVDQDHPFSRYFGVFSHWPLFCLFYETTDNVGGSHGTRTGTGSALATIVSINVENEKSCAATRGDGAERDIRRQLPLPGEPADEGRRAGRPPLLYERVAECPEGSARLTAPPLFGRA
jgi:hypothetical protein